MALYRRLLGQLKNVPSGRVAPPLSDPSFISVTQTNNVITLGNIEDDTDDYFIFKTTVETGATSTTFSTDSESSDCSFTASTGRFTTTTAGDYRIGVVLVLTVSATTSFTIKVYVDGSSVYSQAITVNASVDPQPISINLIESLTADQYVRVRIDRSSDENIYPRAGSTFTMNRLGPSGGGGGGGSLTIDSNVSGHVLKSVGSSNTITGHATSAFPANTLLSGAYSASTGDQGMVGDFSALYIDGIGADGSKQRYQLVLSGGILQTKAVDAR